MDGKICVVTGGTGGIGKAAALELAARGASVALTGRNPEKGRLAVKDAKARAKYPDRISFHQADFTSLDEVRELGGELAGYFKSIDVLINNAGAIFLRREETRDGFEKTFGVNHLAPFVLTGILLEKQAAAAPTRIVNVASRAHTGRTLDFNDLQMTRRYAGGTAYGRSKLANILFTQALARRLDGTGVTANSMHPGFVHSDFARNNGFLARLAMDLASPIALTPEQGADTVVFLASHPSVVEVNGGYFVKRRAVDPSPQAQDLKAAERLWQVSEDLSRFTYPRPDQLRPKSAS